MHNSVIDLNLSFKSDHLRHAYSLLEVILIIQLVGRHLLSLSELSSLYDGF